MIVQRVYTKVKAGKLAEYLELMESRPDMILRRVTKRDYTANIGAPIQTVCHEAEFEDLDAMDKVWAEWWADPETPAYMEKFWAVVDDARSEVWNLIE